MKTVQGEGPSTGHQAVFLRLGGCNLKCSWCDTPYTWDWMGESDTAKARAHVDRDAIRAGTFNAMAATGADAERIARGGGWNPREEVKPMELLEVATALKQKGLDAFYTNGWPLLVISGGEPLLQQIAIQYLLEDFEAEFSMAGVEIETNGTITPSRVLGELVTAFNVSPKLASSHNPEALRFNRDSLAWFAGTPKARFKFVCTGPEDFQQVDDICTTIGIMTNRVWIMPEGISKDAIETGGAALAEKAIERGYNISTRLHVLLWGAKRGV